MRNYLKLLTFLKGHRKLFSIAVITMLVAGFMEVFQLSLLVPLVDVVFTRKKIVVPHHLPDFLAHIVNKINTIQPSMEFLTFLAGGFIVMLFLKNFLIFTYQYLMGEVSQRIMKDIRFRLYDNIINLSLDYFSRKRTGELISRITNDVNVVENAVSYGLTDLFRQTFILFMWLVTALTIEPQGTLYIFLLFPIIGFFVTSVGRTLKKVSRKIQETMADISSLLLETISGIKVVKGFCTENYETSRFARQNHDYYKLRIKSIKRLIVIPPITELIGGVCGAVIILMFGQRLLREELSFGVFILFFASIMEMISPIKKLGNVNALTQQALAANERIYDVLEARPTVKERPHALTLKEMQRSISIENVDFEYDHESGLVLKNINLEIKKGELVAIVGPTGTGKTTVVNLIPRFYDPTRGVVRMDGVDLKEAAFLSLRAQIGIVTQESILFNDTVRANIAYGRREATLEEIQLSAKKAFAHQFIENMPQKYDTVIGDRGFRLSGGEKQRVAIARAILKNPPILILDEATSSLDSESEKYVQEALDELMEGRTVIAIAHRFSTIKKASKIVVLEQGKIAGIGTHEALLKSCPLYERLSRMQFHMAVEEVVGK